MKLQPIETAPKDGRFILLFGDSGYTTTPLRCEVGRWYPEYRPRNPWQTHSNDAFTDGGPQPIYWCEIPTTELDKNYIRLDDPVVTGLVEALRKLTKENTTLRVERALSAYEARVKSIEPAIQNHGHLQIDHKYNNETTTMSSERVKEVEK